MFKYSLIVLLFLPSICIKKECVHYEYIWLYDVNLWLHHRLGGSHPTTLHAAPYQETPTSFIYIQCTMHHSKMHLDLDVQLKKKACRHKVADRATSQQNQNLRQWHKEFTMQKRIYYAPAVCEWMSKNLTGDFCPTVFKTLSNEISVSECGPSKFCKTSGLRAFLKCHSQHFWQCPHWL